MANRLQTPISHRMAVGLDAARHSDSGYDDLHAALFTDPAAAEVVRRRESHSTPSQRPGAVDRLMPRASVRRPDTGFPRAILDGSQRSMGVVVASAAPRSGTLVERTTRFTKLIHLPREDGHGVIARTHDGPRSPPTRGGHHEERSHRRSHTVAIATTPEQLRRSLTWEFNTPGGGSSWPLDKRRATPLCSLRAQPKEMVIKIVRVRTFVGLGALLIASFAITAAVPASAGNETSACATQQVFGLVVGPGQSIQDALNALAQTTPSMARSVRNLQACATAQGTASALQTVPTAAVDGFAVQPLTLGGTPHFEGSITITGYDCTNNGCVAAGSATLFTQIDLGYTTFRVLSRRTSSGAYWTSFGASMVCTASCGTFRVNTSTTWSDQIKTFARSMNGVSSQLVTSFTGSWRGSTCSCPAGATQSSSAVRWTTPASSSSRFVDDR